MTKKFSINEKRYTAKPFDVNTICDMEEMGVSLDSMRKMPFSMIRAYFAICADMDRAEAGKEMESHIIHGGKLEEISDALKYEMENSDFFHSLSQTAETEDAEGTEPESEEK